MRKWVLIALACLVIGALIASFAGQAAGQTKRPVTVRRGDLLVAAVASGNLTLPHQVDLNFAITGTLKEIRVVRGESVKKGQALAKLDDTPYQDAVRRQTLQLQQDEKALELAQLDLNRAQEQLDEATPQTGQQYTYYTDLPSVRLNVNSALSKIAEAMARIKDGETTYADAELAYAENYLKTALTAASRTQFIPIERQRTVAETISAVRQLTYLRDRAQIAAGRAQVTVETTKFTLEQAKRDLSKTVLAAPFDGVISDVSKLDEGSSLTSSTKILHLVDVGQVEMNGLMMELDVAEVKVGQDAIVTVDALANTQLKGKVTFVSPAATVTSGVVSYAVGITLDIPAGGLSRDGMTARARIVTGQRTNVLLIPRQAVSNIGGQERSVEVMVDQRTGKTEQRRVTIGLGDGESVEVISGLKEGETVLVS